MKAKNNVVFDSFFQETIFNMFPYKLPAFPKVELSNSAIHELHYHNSIEIGYCYHGVGECISENGRQTFKKGDAEFFFPFQPHLSRGKSHEKCIWDYSYFNISDVFLSNGFEITMWDNLVESQNGITGIIKYDEHPEICEYIKKIIETSHSKEKNKLLKCRLLIGELLVHVTEQGRSDIDCEIAIRYNKRLIKLSPALAHIKNHYSETVTVQQLADLCSMSISSFRENFTREMKMSPQEYLISTRMKFAKYYLLNSSKTISEICSICGFKDVANFHKHFSKRFKMSPASYRKSNIPNQSSNYYINI